MASICAAKTLAAARAAGEKYEAERTLPRPGWANRPVNGFNTHVALGRRVEESRPENRKELIACVGVRCG
jgi:hypothetical protein